MKNRVRVMIYLMIVVIVAGGIYLWTAGGKSAEDVMGKLDPESYDVTVTCYDVVGNNLICNKGNDTYLFLDDVKVYLKKSDTVVKENGDEETKISYGEASIGDLKDKIKENKEVSLSIWLTDRGKTETIMILEESFENNNASLANLDGLDPSTYTSANVVMGISKKGMRLAPISYTAADKDKFKEFIKFYSFTRDVKYYHMVVAAGENGVKNIQYAKSSYQQLASEMTDGKLSAYIWFNKNGDIAAVMTYNE